MNEGNELIHWAINYFHRILMALFRWFSQLTTVLPFLPFLFSVFTLYVISRFILSPLFGSIGSDSVKSLHDNLKKGGKKK